ncbi:N-succinyldiaminopimelate aminotransferase [Intrasporangium oryzae NRRL B-24470]|uniref:N-succinyldiaminopimelate aminotransferase n=1 Tax=Intrasporangium oryzae NRRL B-24470 TaxID=1386089 RepID=W9G729_9MICO|nr:succinyldiaminopimelate transaminase [Intrasporangium oryzae]EWT01082.1 N-succinyldiaminopimelate aminotransferase [Intrasporangium oryzae NRRL B-24470]
MSVALTPLGLPDFPWDSLAPYKARAVAHPDGIVDLSVGTPVDPTPEVVQRALAAAADAPGYPTTAGTDELREAICAWFERRRGVTGLQPGAVLPTIGSKELVAWLPTLLGIGAGDLVGIPAIAYPTYDVGARLAGATAVVAQSLTSLGPLTPSTTPKLVWLNSPGNPHGQVLGVEHLRKVVRWARQHGVIVASDECYAELDWRDGTVGTTPSILHPDVCEGSHDGLLAVYSLSKQSNLAGYRSAFVAGDPELIGRILEVRKHAGMIVPAPVQHAMTVALGDDTHVETQRTAYARRRALLLDAVARAGLRVDHSEAGLYLWATREEDCWTTVSDLADRGILVAPGAFYGEAGRQHVRIALTATDERVAAACARL